MTSSFSTGYVEKYIEIMYRNLENMFGYEKSAGMNDYNLDGLIHIDNYFKRTKKQSIFQLTIHDFDVFFDVEYDGANSFVRKYTWEPV